MRSPLERWSLQALPSAPLAWTVAEGQFAHRWAPELLASCCCVHDLQRSLARSCRAIPSSCLRQTCKPAHACARVSTCPGQRVPYHQNPPIDCRRLLLQVREMRLVVLHHLLSSFVRDVHFQRGAHLNVLNNPVNRTRSCLARKYHPGEQVTPLTFVYSMRIELSLISRRSAECLWKLSCKEFSKCFVSTERVAVVVWQPSSQ